MSLASKRITTLISPHSHLISPYIPYSKSFSTKTPNRPESANEVPKDAKKSDKLPEMGQNTHKDSDADDAQRRTADEMAAKMERIMNLDKADAATRARNLLGGHNVPVRTQDALARIMKGENVPMRHYNIGKNKLAQAMAHDIMARDVASNMIKYTNFDEQAGPVQKAHNVFVTLFAVLFFGLLTVYASYENFRTLWYGRDVPEVWGHVPIPWNDPERLKEEYPQSIWPWQKDHAWQKYWRAQKEFEELKQKMKESGEL